MRPRDNIICLVSVLLAFILLIFAGRQLDYINSQRQEMKLIINAPLENAPPSLAFATVAMGAFRGLVVDVLWMRADRLKEEGQFFDAKQIAEWITVLQPRFASVWDFHSWNMAYNISVAIPATQPDERWRWVKNGYELLRDKGIILNPKSILLYRQLAMIFQHKIGGVTDDVHKYYKLQLAEGMGPLLGGADEAYFHALAVAPADFKEAASDANVALFVQRLKSADAAFTDDSRFVGNYLSLREKPDRFKPKAFEVIDDYRGTRILKQFDTFAKAHQLRSVWKLEPVLMQQLNRTYGPIDWTDPNRHLPLDWRHPQTHAIYWAIKGLQTAGKKEFSVDEANTDRIVAHSLQNLFRNGKIFIYDEPVPASSDTFVQPGPSERKDIFLRPDLRMFETYNRSRQAVLEKYKGKGGTYESMQIGYRNMLVNALFMFYQAGHLTKAEEIYKQLRQMYDLDEFKVSLVEFVRKRLHKELEFIELFDAKEMIQMMLQESYFRYAMHDDDEAFSREKMAKEVHDHYQSAYRDENRIDLPKFDLLRYTALMDFRNDQMYPLNLRRTLVERIKIERPKLAKRFEQQSKMLDRQAQRAKPTKQQR